MKTFKQFLEAFKDYRGGWRGQVYKYDDKYYDKKLDTLKDDNDKTIAWRFKLEPKEKINAWASDIIPKHDDIIHRGMSHDEYENILKTGKIRSNGSGNIGTEQEGLTYFTTDPDSAASYSNSFALSKHKPTPEKPAYIVSVKKPNESRIKNIKGTGEHEVGVTGDIPMEDIVAIHRGNVIAHEPGETHYSTFHGRGQFEKDIWKNKNQRFVGKTKVGSTSRLHWERIK